MGPTTRYSNWSYTDACIVGLHLEIENMKTPHRNYNVGPPLGMATWT